MKFLLLRLIACSALLLSVQHNSIAASFNCNQSDLAAIELLVCHTPKVSALDEHLAVVYQQVLDSTADSTSSGDSLKEDQLRWISNVRNKCTDTTCLELTYLARIGELNQAKDIVRNSPSGNAPTAGQYMSTPIQPNVSEAELSPKTTQIIPSGDKEIQDKLNKAEGTKILEYAILIFVGVILLGIVLGFKQTITVFRDYNDLAIVFFSGGLLFWTVILASGKYGLSDMHILHYAMLIASIALMIYLIIRTVIDNQFSIWKIPIALITKLTLSILFIFNLMSLLSPSGKTQSQRSRNRANAVMWLIFLTPVIHGLVKNKTGIFMPASVFNRYQRGRIGIK